MNYLRIYNEICLRAKNGQKQCESPSQSPAANLVSHLIIPGGIWGSTNTPENTIALTPHAQIVAYKLLVRIYPYSKSIKQTLKDLLKARGKKRRKIPYKRKPHSPETRAKMAAAHRGKKFSVESRMKMSAAKKGKPFSAEHVANRSAARRRNAKGFSEASKLKMSLAAKNRTKKTKWSVSQ